MADDDATRVAYMARRALGLLITRPGLTDATDFEISFQPKAGKEDEPGRRPTLRLVLHLLNSWLAMRGLINGVVPFLNSDNSSWAEDTAGSGPAEETAPSRRIDWQATLPKLASGGGPVMKSRWRVRDEANRRYLALVLAEAAVHSEELLARLQDQRQHLAAPLVAMLADLQHWLDGVRDLAEDERSRTSLAPVEVVEELRQLFATELEDEGSSPLFDAYRSRSELLVGSGPKQFAINELTQRLSAWRDQYLAGQVWLCDVAGLDLPVGRPDGLYELWCFAELLAMARQQGVPNVAQNSFLRRDLGDPAFDLGPGFYAFYDFGEHSFRTVSSDRLFTESRGSTPVLPGAHVEWFIRDSKDFRNSLVLDTKYYSKWDSGQALKVLGYMQNFGVRQGAIVFPCDLEALGRRVKPLAPGIFQMSCPADPEALFWVLRLEPTVEAEARNREVLERFVSKTLIR